MRFRVLAALLLALVAACSTSKVDPEADVVIGGTLSSQGGAPASGARVALSKEPDAFEGILTVASLGLACITEEAEEACGDAEVGETDEAGRFAFEIKGRDTQTTFGTAATLDVAATLERNGDELEGPAIVQRFQAQTEKLDMPISFWRPAVTFGDNRKVARVGWDDVTSAVPKEANPSTARFDVVFRQGGRTVWFFPGHKTRQAFDSRILEDTSGDVAVFADLDDISLPEEQGSGVDLLLRSARVGYRARAGVPDSRDKPCVSNASGRPETHSPCPLTDGDLFEDFGIQSCEDDPCPTPSQSEWVYIDLGKAIDVALVVARGCSNDCRMESSMDAQRWSAIGLGNPASSGRGLERDDLFAEGTDDVAIKPAKAVRARYVRVVPDNDVSDLREISVFDPVLAAEPAADPGDPFFPGAGGGAGSGRWWLVAGIAVGAIALAVFLRLRIRRRAD